MGVGKLAPRYALDVANLPTPNPLNYGSLVKTPTIQFFANAKLGDTNDH